MRMNIFYISGDQENNWQQGTVDLTLYITSTNFQFRFGVILTSEESGVITIDDVILKEDANCVNPPTVTLDPADSQTLISNNGSSLTHNPLTPLLIIPIQNRQQSCFFPLRNGDFGLIG